MGIASKLGWDLLEEKSKFLFGLGDKNQQMTCGKSDLKDI